MKVSDIIVVLFCVFVVVSCKKDKLTEEKEVLIGVWEWRYTSHSYGWCENMQILEVLNPETEDVNYSIEFKREGKIKMFENGSTSDKYRLVFSYWEIDNSGNPVFQIDLNNDPENILIGGHYEDTLWLKNFPFKGIEGCENHVNYFVSE